MYSSTNLDIEIRMNTNGKTVSLSLSVPDFAVETRAFLDALEFEEPVDGITRTFITIHIIVIKRKRMRF